MGGSTASGRSVAPIIKASSELAAVPPVVTRGIKASMATALLMGRIRIRCVPFVRPSTRARALVGQVVNSLHLYECGIVSCAIAIAAELTADNTVIGAIGESGKIIENSSCVCISVRVCWSECAGLGLGHNDCSEDSQDECEPEQSQLGVCSFYYNSAYALSVHLLCAAMKVSVNAWWNLKIEWSTMLVQIASYVSEQLF